MHTNSLRRSHSDRAVELGPEVSFGMRSLRRGGHAFSRGRFENSSVPFTEKIAIERHRLDTVEDILSRNRALHLLLAVREEHHYGGDEGRQYDEYVLH